MCFSDYSFKEAFLAKNAVVILFTNACKSIYTVCVGSINTCSSIEAKTDGTGSFNLKDEKK